MTPEMIKCLAIFVAMVLGYVFYDKLKISMGTTAMAALLLCVFTGLVPAKTALGYFANKNVILILGMFVVVTGFNRTQAVRKMSHLVTKVSGGSFKKMFAGYALIGCLLSQFIPSPMSVYAVMFPLVMASCEDMGVSPSKAMFPLALVVIGTCGTLPLGAGAVTFAQYNGYLEAFGITDISFTMMDFFYGRIITLVVVVIYAIFVGAKISPEQPPVAITTTNAKARGGKEIAPLDPVREVIGYSVFILTVIGLVAESKIGIPGWQVTLTGAVLMVISGVLTPKEATDSFPFRIVLMIIGALVMGSAMSECGLGDKIGELVAAVVGETRNGYIIGALFFVVPFIMTQFMNNQSCQAIFLPIVILSCQALGCDPRGPLILLSAACLTAFLTPMATGTIPMVMGTGGYDQASLIKQGWLPSLIITAVSVLSVMTLYPAF